MLEEQTNEIIKDLVKGQAERLFKKDFDPILEKYRKVCREILQLIPGGLRLEFGDSIYQDTFDTSLLQIIRSCKNGFTGQLFAVVDEAPKYDNTVIQEYYLRKAVESLTEENS